MKEKTYLRSVEKESKKDSKNCDKYCNKCEKGSKTFTYKTLFGLNNLQTKIYQYYIHGIFYQSNSSPEALLKKCKFIVYIFIFGLKSIAEAICCTGSAVLHHFQHKKESCWINVLSNDKG